MKVIIGKEVIIANSHILVFYIIINWGKVICTIRNLGHVAWGETMIGKYPKEPCQEMVKELKLAKYYFWAFPLSVFNILDYFCCVYLSHAKVYPKYAKIDGNC
jgi:hypothetical protein